MSVVAVEDLEIPRVQGRHRNKALAKARQARAIQLVVSGRSYQQVADEMGYANRGTVYRLVNRPLAAATKESAEDARAQAFMRLETLLRAVWDRAMTGDIPAGRASLGLIVAECRLMGLFDRDSSPSKPPARNCGGHPETVVTREDDCRHEGCAIHGKFMTLDEYMAGSGPSIA